MQLGLVNNNGMWEIPDITLRSFGAKRCYNVDFIFYYLIDIQTFEDIQVFVEYFEKISIEIDPTTINQFRINVYKDFYPSEPAEDEVPF